MSQMTHLSAWISSDDVSEAMLKDTGSFFFSICKERKQPSRMCVC